ncbi:WD40 repeat-like protein [Rhizopogon vinicolor AM-OR11-026]|uniref:WD40 repeat-like protein n=1 Tax=Rhizopogon vinicolor AM-OR11-026 TaxID=1314800 RepID=A0A1B7MH69_9AGAM|nr:WD40 repeat-like protein [Rhizopogon vinicolor AM-OR11-026]
MGSWNRPLPGVRLDPPGQLVVPGCEWHISPLGRSYFVNHNTRTTSWKKSTPEHPASLTTECVIEGHSECIWSLACVADSYNVVSASSDGSIHQWRRYGEQVGNPWRSDGRAVASIAVPPDETMVVSGSNDGRVQLWHIMEEMAGNPWEGHNATVRYLDWSPNACEIASGSEDGTMRRWNPDTGRQIVPPIETGHGWVPEVIVLVQGRAHIFSGPGSLDDTIRKWQSIDGKELVVLRGHTNAITSICLSPNERHFVSASRDCSVRIWDLQINQQVGEPLLHDGELLALATSSDGQYIASGGKDKIYISMEHGDSTQEEW